MDCLVINGEKKLNGEVKISGAKNAALPILFATILSPETCNLKNVPDLADIDTTIKMLQSLGVKATFDKSSRQVEVHAKSVSSIEAPYDLVRTMRASVLTLGPLVARFKKAKVSLPGGCSIGARPVNLHLAALEKLGAKVHIEEGYIHASADKLTGCEFTFDQISVGATENTLMAAVTAEGTTTLHNCAQEPEIVDLARFLKSLGARIHGAGTPTITIDGVQRLGGSDYQIVSDRIEAGTYLIAAAITGGDVFLPNFPSYLISAVIDKLNSTGVFVREESDGIRIQSTGKIKSVDLTTLPFPGYPTDMQAQFMSLMTIAEGTSVINENIFENRFMHVAELLRLGADISVQGNTAVVRGLGGTGKHLTGATVMATDLRASASLVLAGLAAKGTTKIRRIYHLDRGYEKMEEKLRSIGAEIRRELDT